MASKEGVGDNDSVMNNEMDIRRDLELLEKIQDKEERLRALLGPAESYIIWFQKILVWEHPYLTVALLLVVNILFWLATTWRIYCLIGLTGMVAVALEMWVSYVWSETSGSNGSGTDDSESWTEVYPRLMGVPELSSYLARWWVSGLRWLDSAISLRAENQPKFFVYSLFFLTLFAVIGIYIPGIYVSYFSVMGLLLWPSLSYHNIIGRLRERIDPIIERIEQKLNIKRRRNKKGGKRRSRRRKQEQMDESDSDRDIEEFIPPADALMLTTLTKAVMNPSGSGVDEDEDSASYTPSEFTPRMPSQGESHDHTDDELLSEEISMLAHDVKEMPSFDDLDNTQQSETQMFLPQTNSETDNAENTDRFLNISEDDDDDHEQHFLNPEMPRNLAEADKMTFVASHFKESSDEDEEEKLATGLSFSDMPDVLEAEPRTEESQSKVLGAIGGLISQSHSSLVAAFKSPVISQTVSSVMSNTLTGLSALRSTVASMTGQESSGAGQVPLSGDAAAACASEGAADSKSPDLQVLESEFEFLEQEELDSMDGNK